MSDHDPICQADPLDDIYFCMCEFIGKVRADEREKVKAEYVPVLMEHLRREAGFADLRAKVEALTPIGVVYPHGLDVLVPRTLIDRADVLALLDGNGDEG